MSTNEAFIRAYRRDPPRAATPAPTAPPLSAASPLKSAQVKSRSLQPAAPLVAPWQSTVEIVAANFDWPATIVAAAPQSSPTAPPATATASIPSRSTSTTPIIGKRPLSSFVAEEPLESLLAAEPTFTPETMISAFRWPPVCRALWQRYADQYGHVADTLLARSTREPGRGDMIGVCSLHAGDGASTTLLCLAVALAAREQSVVLVDANFRAPRLAGLLGVQPNTSWQDVLEQGLSVAEAVIRAESDGIDLLPLDLRAPADREPNGAKLAAGLQTTITAGVLRYAYEFVLVDLGAILAPRSFATVSQLIRNMRIEAAVAVADPKHVERDDFTVAGELLDETGCALVGLIENRTNSAR